jgi:hypothetical protein
VERKALQAAVIKIQLGQKKTTVLAKKSSDFVHRFIMTTFFVDTLA